MIRIKYQGMEAEILWEDLYVLLQESSLPWYTDGNYFKPRISIVGHEKDIVLTAELI